MIYDKRKAWANGQLPPERVIALLRSINPSLAEFCQLRGRVVCIALPEHMNQTEKRQLLECGFYFGRKRGCWAHSGEYRAQAQPQAGRVPAQSPAADPAPAFDRARIAAALANSREAAQLITNALSGAKL